jgi:hypothetical protein
MDIKAIREAAEIIYDRCPSQYELSDSKECGVGAEKNCLVCWLEATEEQVAHHG